MTHWDEPSWFAPFSNYPHSTSSSEVHPCWSCSSSLSQHRRSPSAAGRQKHSLTPLSSLGWIVPINSGCLSARCERVAAAKPGGSRAGSHRCHHIMQETKSPQQPRVKPHNGCRLLCWHTATTLQCSERSSVPRCFPFLM